MWGIVQLIWLFNSPGWKIQVYPVVVGDLGTIGNLYKILESVGIFSDREITNLVREMQLEVLCSSTGIIRQHLAK